VAVLVGWVHIDDLDLALDDEEDVAAVGALLDDVGKGVKGAWLGAHADEVQDVVREFGKEGQFFEQRSHMDTGASERAVGDGVGETGTWRLALLEGVDLTVAQRAAFGQDGMAVVAVALAGDLAQRQRRAVLGGQLLFLALQNGEALLGLVHDGDLDVGKARELLDEVLLVQADDERAHGGDDGGGARNVHEDANLAEEGAWPQLGIGALLVARGDADGATDEPVHGLARLALAEDGVVGLVELRLEVQADLGEKALVGGLEEWKGTQALEQVEGQALDGGGGEGRGANGLGGIGVLVELAHHGKGVRDGSDAVRPHRAAAGPVSTHVGGGGGGDGGGLGEGGVEIDGSGGRGEARRGEATRTAR